MDPKQRPSAEDALNHAFFKIEFEDEVERAIEREKKRDSIATVETKETDKTD